MMPLYDIRYTESNFQASFSYRCFIHQSIESATPSKSICSVKAFEAEQEYSDLNDSICYGKEKGQSHKK